MEKQNWKMKLTSFWKKLTEDQTIKDKIDTEKFRRNSMIFLTGCFIFFSIFNMITRDIPETITYFSFTAFCLIMACWNQHDLNILKRQLEKNHV